MHSLSSSAVSMYVRNRVLGMNAGFLKEEGEEYNIIVRMKEENRNSISAIQSLSIPTPTGQKIKLNEIARVEEFWTPQTISQKPSAHSYSCRYTLQDIAGRTSIGYKKRIKQLNNP